MFRGPKVNEVMYIHKDLISMIEALNTKYLLDFSGTFNHILLIDTHFSCVPRNYSTGIPSLFSFFLLNCFGQISPFTQFLKVGASKALISSQFLIYTLSYTTLSIGFKFCLHIEASQIYISC